MSLGDLVQWIFTVLGAAAAAQQLWKWISGRRAERGLNLLGEQFANEADAERARHELQALEAVVDELRTSTPAVVRVLNLSVRRDELASSIGKSYEEFLRIQAELGDNESAALSGKARKVIEAEMLPMYRREKRRQDQLRLLVVAAVLLLVLPYPLTPSYFFERVTYITYTALSHPSELGGLGKWSGLVVMLVGLAIGAILMLLLRHNQPRSLPPDWLLLLGVGAGTALLILMQVGTFLLALDSEDVNNSIGEYYESGIATANAVMLVLSVLLVASLALRRPKTLL